jgi:hypothetical protein
MSDERTLHNDGNLIRLHEKWMDFTESRISKIEKSIDKIPWILLSVILTGLIGIMNLMALMLKLRL